MQIAAVTLIMLTLNSAQHSAMPQGMTHEEHLRQLAKEAEVKRRGAAAMGFDQDATTHHFLLTDAGGVIQVEARRSDDEASREAIRAHLRTIAAEFRRGVFDAPFETHGEVPPGVEAMKAQKAAIRYRYEDYGSGGRVHIVGRTKAASNAIHEFLRYQIREHRTGDPG
jgi:hypothetical protein